MIRLALLASFFLTGCGSILQPVKDISVNHILDSTLPERTLTAPAPAIAVGRPSLPGYLDRQQLVSRSGEGQIMMNPQHLWSEPLDTGIARVVAENLSRLTGSLNIRPVANFTTLDYTALIDLNVRKFEPGADGGVTLECTWKRQPVTGSGSLTRFFQITVPATALPDPETGRVQAMNEALAALSRQIAREL